MLRKTSRNARKNAFVAEFVFCLRALPSEKLSFRIWISKLLNVYLRAFRYESPSFGIIMLSSELLSAGGTKLPSTRAKTCPSWKRI